MFQMISDLLLQKGLIHLEKILTGDDSNLYYLSLGKIILIFSIEKDKEKGSLQMNFGSKNLYCPLNWGEKGFLGPCRFL